MFQEIRLKIMAIGGQMSHKRLRSRLAAEEFELYCVADIKEARRFQDSSKVDVILIDSVFDKSGEIYQLFCLQQQTPVVLLLHSPEVNWNTLKNLQVDGFILENSGNPELIARIKAVARRSTIEN
jgi:DNA-binding response OmpR family regulator